MKQTRFISIDKCGLQLREAQDGQPSRTVVGRPIIFGVRSRNLTPWSDTRVVYEILEPGCIAQELIGRSDVIYCNNHSTRIEDLIGRSRFGQGTLKLTLHDAYMESECDFPETTNGNDTLVQIRLGNVYGMSFAFEDDWEDTENGVSYERTNETVDGKEVWIRHVKRIKALYDVSNVTHPAYEQTTVGTREASDAIDKAIEEQLKREQPQETEEERKAREAAEAAAKAEEERKAREEQERKEQEEREARELEEQEQRFREQRAMRMRARAKFLNDEILETLNY